MWSAILESMHYWSISSYLRDVGADYQPLAESHAGEFMGQSERLYA
jgi:hypothetical protein